MEGLYTRWHLDIGFANAHSALKRLYPDLATLPTPEQVFDWQSKYNKWVQLVRKVYEDDANATWDREAQNETNALRKELDDLEYAWSPPPHLCPWKTPVPQRYYVQAAGTHTPWKLSKVWSDDLVPVEQSALVQDVMELPEMDSIHTADARACISLCRPHGHYVERRKLPRQRGLITTQTHQSGELSLRPLTPDEDNLRGMLTGLVATPECLASKFKLRSDEAQVFCLFVCICPYCLSVSCPLRRFYVLLR